MILVTGSSGLIGAALVDHFRQLGWQVTGLDCRPAPTTDIVLRLTPETDIVPLLAGQRGVIHLAGVSRVVWGQRDPATCWNDNVRNTAALIEAIRQAPRPPWLCYASSREVYGQVKQLPAMDDAPVAPLNTYACSKAASEILIQNAIKSGQLHGGIMRFSTVYGGLNDHSDRVIPAFMRAAIDTSALTVYGKDVAIDPTWLGDVVDGISRLSVALNDNQVPIRPILFSSGQLIRLVDIAKALNNILGSRSSVLVQAARTFDVEQFAGIPRYASELLGWTPTTSLNQGLRLYARMLGAQVKA